MATAAGHEHPHATALAPGPSFRTPFAFLAALRTRAIEFLTEV
jgi:hypothetical protein